MSSAAAATAPDLDPVIKNYRLLQVTQALPATGAATLAWRADGQWWLADLHALSHFGQGPAALVAFPLDQAPAALVGVARLHQAVRRLRPHNGASLISRPRWLTSYALAGKQLTLRYSPIIRNTDAPYLPVTAGTAGNDVTALENTLSKYPDGKAILLAKQGVLVLGKDIGTASRLLITLEETAHLTHQAEVLGGAQPFPDDAAARTAKGIVGAPNGNIGF